MAIRKTMHIMLDGLTFYKNILSTSSTRQEFTPKLQMPWVDGVPCFPPCVWMFLDLIQSRNYCIVIHFFAKIVASIKKVENSDYLFVDRFIFEGNCLCIPEPSLCLLVIKDAHNVGQFEKDKTLSLVWEHFYWPGVDWDVSYFVQQCCLYNALKGSTANVGLYGLCPRLTTNFAWLGQYLCGHWSLLENDPLCSLQGHFDASNVTNSLFSQRLLTLDRDTHFMSSL